MTAPITDAPITAERRAQVQRWLNAGCECETCVILRGYEALCAQLESRLKIAQTALERYAEGTVMNGLHGITARQALAAMAAQTEGTK